MSIDRGEAERLGLSLGSAATATDPHAAATMTKARLVALSRALQRVYASSLGESLTQGLDAQAPPLAVGLFQRRVYFQPEAERFAAYASLGATTLVGFPGAPGELPKGVVHVDLSDRPELEDGWVLGIFNGALAGVIVGVDDKGLVDGATLEASRRFVVRWTVEPPDAVTAMHQLIAPIRTRLDRRTGERVEASLRASREADPKEVASHFVTLVHALAPLVEIGQSVRGRDNIAETDLLTGLRNRTFLERYLPKASESAAVVAALLIDVDNVGELNERHGVAAGDAALVAVAGVLAAERRPGDVLVRYGEDKFLFLAAVDGAEGATSIADRLVVATRAARLDYPFEDETVTASIGVAVVDPAQLPIERLTEAVQLAKLLGKNVARLAD